MMAIVEAQSWLVAPVFTVVLGRYHPGISFKAVSYIVKRTIMFSISYLDSYFMV
jgi:hypothetical protein